MRTQFSIVLLPTHVFRILMWPNVCGKHRGKFRPGGRARREPARLPGPSEGALSPAFISVYVQSLLNGDLSKTQKNARLNPFLLMQIFPRYFSNAVVLVEVRAPQNGQQWRPLYDAAQQRGVTLTTIREMGSVVLSRRGLDPTVQINEMQIDSAAFRTHSFWPINPTDDFTQGSKPSTLPPSCLAPTCISLKLGSAVGCFNCGWLILSHSACAAFWCTSKLRD